MSAALTRILEVGAALVAGVFIFFTILQWLSDRTYKPTRKDVAAILRAQLEDKLDIGRFDEFYSVRIAYDPELEDLRHRFRSLVDDPKLCLKETPPDNAVALNDSGKAQLRELISKVEGASSAGNSDDA
jgi:hypothetical protein